MLFYVFSQKLDKIHLILPIFYLVAYIGLAIFGEIITLRGIDLLDITYFPNIIGYTITEIFYIAQIIFGIYLLMKK